MPQDQQFHPQRRSHAAECSQQLLVPSQSLGTSPVHVTRRLDESATEESSSGMPHGRQNEQPQVCATKQMILINHMLLREKVRLKDYRVGKRHNLQI